MTRTRAALAAAVLPVVLLAAACGSSSEEPEAERTAAGACRYPEGGSPAAKPASAPTTVPDGTPIEMTISTNAGDIPITLEPDVAPCTVASFVALAAQGYYDDTPCHRVSTAPYFILQCGDPTGTASGGPGYTFDNELVPDDPRLRPCSGVGTTQQCTYNAGAVAMANSGQDGTNGSQFFLVYKNSLFPPLYPLFGHMDAAGVKVVSQIAARGISPDAGPGATDGAPKDPVTITGIE